MAPTQILAQQHYDTLTKLLKPFGVNIGLQTSQTKLDGDIIVGTQALLNNDFDAGLIVIDEQHKFGVAQRALLQHKGGTPHVLTMTATPIPRTMALVLYGDLDLSQLTELPVGRKTIKTWVVPEEKRELLQSSGLENKIHKFFGYVRLLTKANLWEQSVQSVWNLNLLRNHLLI